MSASVDDGARYQRQRMLTEVGDAGQARLQATLVRLEGGSPAARSHAADYLARAGVSLASALPASRVGSSAAPPEQPVTVGSALSVPDPLQPAADLLEGALSAVEAIKATLGVGQPAALPPDLLLLGDD